MALVSFPSLGKRTVFDPIPECAPSACSDVSDRESISSIDEYVPQKCRYKLTPHGCEVASVPTTKIECPSTVRKGATTLFRYPHRFQSLIMQKEVHLDMFKRDQLHDIMLQCFESPFESPSRSSESRTAVRVEFSTTPKTETTTRLRKLSDRSRR